MTVKQGMTEYDDTITEKKLIDYINEFLLRVGMRDKVDVTFQCSYDGSVFDNTYEKLGTKFEQMIGDKKFTYTIDGFAQVSKACASFAHDRVLEILGRFDRRGIPFIGIGGESLIYGIAVGFEKMSVYTNSSGVHSDNLKNISDHKPGDCISCSFVDYSAFELSKANTRTICVTNVSRNGMRQDLCKKLDQLYMTDIVGVYCSEKYMTDLTYLKNYYILDQYEYNGIRVVHFRRVHIVSLGNNCCIAYQLQKLGLRYDRYPFDWCRYNNADQLIRCLEDGMVEFRKPTDSRKVVNGVFPIVLRNFGDTDEVSKEILVNSYGMSFPHDKREDMDGYGYRIVRMFFLRKVDYVLDCKITDDQIKKVIELLPNLRRLIIVGDVDYTSDDGRVIKIDISGIKYDHTPDAWKKDHVDWKGVVFDV